MNWKVWLIVYAPLNAKVKIQPAIQLFYHDLVSQSQQGQSAHNYDLMWHRKLTKVLAFVIIFWSKIKYRTLQILDLFSK